MKIPVNLVIEWLENVECSEDRAKIESRMDQTH